MAIKFIPAIDIAVRAGLGGLSGSLATSTVTPPLSSSGILNLAALGNTCVLAVSGAVENAHRIRKCKISCVTASRNLAYSILPAGTATPAIKADGDGSVDEGSLILAGVGTEFVSISGDRDLWIVSSASPTVCQITVFEV